MKYKKILIMGLPGSGKTTLAEKLTKRLNVMWYNADSVRSQVYPDLGYSADDRITQAMRMGNLCDIVNSCGMSCIADFVCPTPECRKAFGADYTIFVNRISEGRFEDTNKMFIPPESPNITLTTGTPDEWVQAVLADMGLWDDKKSTALLLVNSQPLSADHKYRAIEAIGRVGQCCIAVKDTPGPHSFSQIKESIQNDLANYLDNIKIISIPNIVETGEPS